MLGLLDRARRRLAGGWTLPPSLPAMADEAAPVVAAAIGVVRLWDLLGRAEQGVDGLELCLLLWAFTVGVVVLALPKRTGRAGEIALGFVAIHEVGRGWLEFLREPAPDPFGQGVAFAVAAVAGALLVAGRRGRGGARRAGRASTWSRG